MANRESHNPLICDSLGSVTALDKTIVGIIVNPSNTNWAVVFVDNDGNEIFRHSSTVNESKAIPIRFFTNGISANTLTNITSVHFYTNEA